MLVEHGIRFPEGRRRLEDHLFVVHAYFHAAGISVLADRPCYHWTLARPRRRTRRTGALDPEGYYGNVREVLDLVLEHTEPGPVPRPPAHALVPRQDARARRRRAGSRAATTSYNRELVDDDPRARARALRRARARRGSRSTCRCARRCCASGRYDDAAAAGAVRGGLRAARQGARARRRAAAGAAS